jgi:N-acetylmuramoyl-L-alanine amidase
VSEEDCNLPIIQQVAAGLTKRGIETRTVTYYPRSGYGSAMAWVADFARRERLTGAVEFHFNAFNKQARGHEVLHWESSVRGVTLAAAILKELDRQFPNQPSRGLKKKHAGDRGALFLSLLHCPSVIAEPFFGDCREDWEIFWSDWGRERLVTAYVDSISNWVEGLTK